MSPSMQSFAQVQAGLQRAPELTRRHLLSMARQATLLIERELKEEIPRGATGLSAASITSDAFATPDGAQGVVGSANPVVAYLDLGTKPHMPPVQALVPWVRAVLGVSADEAPGVAFLVARKIAARGTKARNMFAKVQARTQPAVVRMFEQAASDIARDIAGGLA